MTDPAPPRDAPLKPGTVNEEPGPGVDQWVDRYGDGLFRYALFRLGDPDAAADLVQETFLAAVASQDRFSRRSSEKTWLVGILKHKIIDHLRRIMRERTVFPRDLPVDPSVDELFDADGEWRVSPVEWETDPGKVVSRKEFWDVFRRCLSGLPPQHGAAYSLRELNELEAGEVCKKLGITPTNLWVILHRARMRLRLCLEKNWFGAGGEEKA